MFLVFLLNALNNTEAWQEQVEKGQDWHWYLKRAPNNTSMSFQD